MSDGERNRRGEEKMKVRVQVVIESETGESEIVQLERRQLRMAEFGLTLAEAKEVMQKLQRRASRVLDRSPRFGWVVFRGSCAPFLFTAGRWIISI